jgi:predicted hydrocarbon binding protein
MKGIINKGIQEFVEHRFGAKTWEDIKKLAKCDEPFFSASEVYPDEMTLALVKAASEVSGLPPDQVLIEFGKFWVPNTGAASYPTYFKLAGKNSREFLLNMDKVHHKVTSSIGNAHPPRFEYEEQPNGRLLIRYSSKRKLCPVLMGLIYGVGLYFNENLTVNETTCMNKGDSVCTMEVVFS